VSLGSKDETFHTKIIPSHLYDSIKSTLAGMGYAPKDIDKKLSELPNGMTDAGEIIPYIIKELS
jgi:Holliday junction resolvasome RuvABC DNA-binding subunit